MKDTTKKICINGMGIALFVALTLCVQVPIFENYYICLGYLVMVLYCYMFGAVSGAIVGCIGTILYCVLTGGLNGMPGWALGNLVIGVMFGIMCKLTSKMKSKTLRHIVLSTTIIFSTAIGILGIKSFMEALLYAHPFWIRIAKNMPAFIADVIVLIIGLPVCAGLAPTLKKQLHINNTAD